MPAPLPSRPRPQAIYELDRKTFTYSRVYETYDVNATAPDTKWDPLTSGDAHMAAISGNGKVGRRASARCCTNQATATR